MGLLSFRKPVIRKWTEAAGVPLSSTIIPALSIKGIPDSIDFGTLAAGEASYFRAPIQE
jgi:hypothetical protein